MLYFIYLCCACFFCVRPANKELNISKKSLIFSPNWPEGLVQKMNISVAIMAKYSIGFMVYCIKKANFNLYIKCLCQWLECDGRKTILYEADKRFYRYVICIYRVTKSIRLMLHYSLTQDIYFRKFGSKNFCI